MGRNARKFCFGGWKLEPPNENRVKGPIRPLPFGNGNNFQLTTTPILHYSKCHTVSILELSQYNKSPKSNLPEEKTGKKIWQKKGAWLLTKPLSKGGALFLPIQKFFKFSFDGLQSSLIFFYWLMGWGVEWFSFRAVLFDWMQRGGLWSGFLFEWFSFRVVFFSSGFLFEWFSFRVVFFSSGFLFECQIS